MELLVQYSSDPQELFDEKENGEKSLYDINNTIYQSYVIFCFTQFFNDLLKGKIKVKSLNLSNEKILYHCINYLNHVDGFIPLKLNRVGLKILTKKEKSDYSIIIKYICEELIRNSPWYINYKNKKITIYDWIEVMPTSIDYDGSIASEIFGSSNDKNIITNEENIYCTYGEKFLRGCEITYYKNKYNISVREKDYNIIINNDKKGRNIIYQKDGVFECIEYNKRLKKYSLTFTGLQLNIHKIYEECFNVKLPNYFDKIKKKINKEYEKLRIILDNNFENITEIPKLFDEINYKINNTIIEIKDFKIEISYRKSKLKIKKDPQKIIIRYLNMEIVDLGDKIILNNFKILLDDLFNIYILFTKNNLYLDFDIKDIINKNYIRKKKLLKHKKFIILKYGNEAKIKHFNGHISLEYDSILTEEKNGAKGVKCGNEHILYNYYNKTYTVTTNCYKLYNNYKKIYSDKNKIRKILFKYCNHNNKNVIKKTLNKYFNNNYRNDFIVSNKNYKIKISESNLGDFYTGEIGLYINKNINLNVINVIKKSIYFEDRFSKKLGKLVTSIHGKNNIITCTLGVSEIINVTNTKTSLSSYISRDSKKNINLQVEINKDKNYRIKYATNKYLSKNKKLICWKGCYDKNNNPCLVKFELFEDSKIVQMINSNKFKTDRVYVTNIYKIDNNKCNKCNARGIFDFENKNYCHDHALILQNQGNNVKAINFEIIENEIDVCYAPIYHFKYEKNKEYVIKDFNCHKNNCDSEGYYFFFNQELIFRYIFEDDKLQNNNNNNNNNESIEFKTFEKDESDSDDDDDDNNVRKRKTNIDSSIELAILGKNRQNDDNKELSEKDNDGNFEKNKRGKNTNENNCLVC